MTARHKQQPLQSQFLFSYRWDVWWGYSIRVWLGVLRGYPSELMVSMITIMKVKHPVLLLLRKIKPSFTQCEIRSSGAAFLLLRLERQMALTWEQQRHRHTSSTIGPKELAAKHQRWEAPFPLLPLTEGRETRACKTALYRWVWASAPTPAWRMTYGRRTKMLDHRQQLRCWKQF